MIQSNKLRMLQRMRIKSILSYDEKNMAYNTLLIFNTLNIDKLQEKMGPIKLKNPSMMKNMYLDKKVNISIGSKKIVKNLFNDMEKDYATIASQFNSIKKMPDAKLKNSSKNLNLLYSLHRINEIYKNNCQRLPKAKAPVIYWQLVKDYAIRPFLSYKYKTMIIPMSDFESNIREALNGNPASFNPAALLYRYMRYNFDDFVKLGNIDIIFVKNQDSLRVNPQECGNIARSRKNYNPANDFRKELFKLLNKIDVEKDISDSDRIYDMDLKTQKITNSILSTYTGGATGEIPQDVKNKVADIVEDAVKASAKSKNKSEEEISEEEVKDEINNNKKLLAEIAKESKSNAVKLTASTKRDQMLREKQLELEVNGKTLGEILNTKTEDVKIEVNDVSKKTKTLNKNVTDVKYPNINKAYIENVMQKDIINAVKSMENNKDIQVYIRNIKVEDSSDINNYKDTYTIDLEDSLRKRHRLTFDVPKFVDDRFMWLGGNKKYINNQQFMLPIVKVAPDIVQLVSNYNKLFVYRYGTKASAINEKVKKALGTGKGNFKVKTGKFDVLNKEYITTIDYDDFAKLYSEINLDDVSLIFNQKEIREEFTDKGFTEEDFETILPLGIAKNKLYYINLENNHVVEYIDSKTSEDTGKDLIEFMFYKSPELEKLVGSQSAGKKYMYNRVKIMNKYVPIILILAFFEGLGNIMNRANVKHYFTDTRPKVGPNETIVQFNDGFLIYENKPFEKALLMNGLLEAPTKNYNFDDFDDSLTYQNIFESMYGRRNIANAFANFRDNFVDPITLEILQKLSLPTDLTGMILYANDLLADSQYRPETDIRSFRFRSAELIPAIVYKKVTKAYEKYKSTAHYDNPRKISIKKDEIIKDIMAQPIIEDYSEINPVTELQKIHGATKKGPAGCNLEEAYTKEQRSFHKSMTGVFTISTSPDKNVGVQRVLTMEPPISDVRGFIDNKAMDGRIEEYNDVNLMGPAEMLNGGSALRDDGMRTAMSTKQFTHVTPTVKSSPSLITNGSEQVVQYHLSKDWSFIAKDDGEVVELDEKNGLMVVKYKNGQTDAVNIGTKIAKNGAGGFYLSKKMIPNFKLGDKIEKNDILAQDRDFFSQSDDFGNQFNVGPLEKVALLSSTYTYEDSSYVSKKMSRDMAAEIVMPKQVVLGPNTNVDYIAKIGDRVVSGDELIRFERSFDENSLNTLLSNVGEDMKEDITMSSRDRVKSKYTGIIEDIKVYTASSLNELSPSLRKIVNDYYSRINKRKKILDKYDDSKNPVVKCGMLFDEPTGKIEPKNGKFKGAMITEGVLIEFYIKIHDELGAGDKIVFFSALKSIITTVIPEGEEAYTEFRPDEKIDAVLSCNSLISRGVASAPLMMMGNKLLIELSRKLKDIYEGK